MAISRTIPSPVRRALRREVGFVCPVDGCGSPYLSYHHFDPPWTEREHHDPAGMIALCLQHHKEADTGVFTREQLSELKRRQNSSPVAGRINWSRSNTLFLAGSNLFFDCPILIQADGKRLAWLTNHGARDKLSLDLRSPSGERVFTMIDNDWASLPRLDDIDASPGTAALSVRSKQHDVSIDLRFTPASYEDVVALAQTHLDGNAHAVALLQRVLPRRDLVVCKISANVKWPAPFHVTPTLLSANPTQGGRLRAAGNLLVSARCGVSLGDGTPGLISLRYSG